MVPFSESPTERIPLRVDSHGVIRVGQTRMPIDTVVLHFNEGDSPEEIADQFPMLHLGDVYFVIGYYLRHRDDVNAYLKEREVEAAQIKKQVESISPQAEIRQRLLAHRQSMGA
jgi:uncharacterized protein (DUF433 family)